MTIASEFDAITAKIAGGGVSSETIAEAIDALTNALGGTADSETIEQAVRSLGGAIDGGGGGGGTMYRFLLCAQTEEPFEQVNFIGDGNYRGGALPAGVFSVYYSKIDMYGAPAVLPLGDTGFIIDAYATACKIQLESTQGNHLSDDIPYETASGWIYGHTIFAVNYSDIKAAIEAFEAQGYTVKQIKITLQSS